MGTRGDEDWEGPYCESLTIKGHWYRCLKVFHTPVPRFASTQTVFRETWQKKTVELASESYTSDALVRVLHDCVRVGMAACVPVLHRASRRLGFSSEVALIPNSRETGLDNGIFTKHVAEWSNSLIPAQVFQKCVCKSSLMSWVHPSRSFWLTAGGLTSTSGSPDVDTRDIKRLHVTREADLLIFFLCISPVQCSFLHLQLYASDNSVHSFRSPWEPNKLYTSLRKRNETCTFFI